MFTQELIVGEINSLGYICEDENVIEGIANKAADIIWEDDYLAGQILDIIDTVISNSNLDRTDEVDW